LIESDPSAFMLKAERACESAKLLLAANDIDGACNRAYYAMFDAARAVLLIEAPDLPLESIKTHSGLIATFGLRLVKPGKVPVALGRVLNRAEEIRLVADYNTSSVDRVDAERLLEQASAFVITLRNTFSI